MKSLIAKFLYKLGIRTDAQKFEDGARYVYETISGAHLSTKEELQPIADRLWRECNPSWEGNHPFDNGMAQALLKMDFRDPGDPDFIADELEEKEILQATVVHNPPINSFWIDVMHNMEPMPTEQPSRRGMTRDLTGEMLMQLEDDNMRANQHLLDTIRTGNFRAASIASARLDDVRLPKLSRYLTMPAVTPPRSRFANKHKTLEEFFKSNTVK
jgi:hypothetical protein